MLINFACLRQFPAGDNFEITVDITLQQILYLLARWSSSAVIWFPKNSTFGCENGDHYRHFIWSQINCI